MTEISNASIPSSQMDAIARAAAILDQADALLIHAGAGMGVDSGLPDYRGNEGFWGAYPPFQARGLSFVDLANPAWFHRDPHLAWGFYGHRLNLYRNTTPHAGFSILKRWGDRMTRGCFVFTSNVDGQFQTAGFSEDQVCEVHGSLSSLQCLHECGVGLISTRDLIVEVDPVDFQAREPLPTCPNCGGPTRPNVLMFGDFGWDSTRSDQQHARLQTWLNQATYTRGGLAIVELGAGQAVPTVRRFSEHLAHSPNVTLIRINLRESEITRNPQGRHLSLALGARAALEAIDHERDHPTSSDISCVEMTKTLGRLDHQKTRRPS